MRRILFVGEQWYGSDSRSLANALSREDNLVWRIDPSSYFMSAGTLTSRIARRLVRPLSKSVFNSSLLSIDRFVKPAIVFVFKGSEIEMKTLKLLKDRGRVLVQFYPDVSLFTHGKDIPSCVPFYDIWLSTKSFGIQDVKAISPKSQIFLVQHGFDKDIHRPVIKPLHHNEYICDLSFIGTWDAEKEKTIKAIKNRLPDIDLKIWGNGWEKCNEPSLKDLIQHHPMNGDFYAYAVQASKINLGLLSHRRFGASSGDLVTARTFQIPACGGFMLHSGNEEAYGMFQREAEASFFETEREAIEKVKYFLSNNKHRMEILERGLDRAKRNHSMDHRAEEINCILKQFNC